MFIYLAAAGMANISPKDIILREPTTAVSYKHSTEGICGSKKIKILYGVRKTEKRLRVYISNKEISNLWISNLNSQLHNQNSILTRVGIQCLNEVEKVQLSLFYVAKIDNERLFRQARIIINPDFSAEVGDSYNSESEDFWNQQG